MKRSTAKALALVVWPICFSQARLLYSGPEDIYAFPKSRVTFLNNLPVSNETAQRWLRDGLRGGDREFLGDSWDEPTWYSQTASRGIDSSEAGSLQEPPKVSQTDSSEYSLEHMRIGPDNAFLCLIPPARDKGASAPEDLDGDETLRNSWSLLQPLSGKCLYHRQTWFTYSYCHNQEIRQFKELVHTHSHPGGYEPTEDPEWEAFTLGRAPLTPEASADVVVADQFPQAANLEVAHGPGSRYLVQRWGDGTFCEKTGKPREVEVQFHCSMTMTDSILLVREAKTCSYVLVVQTPRLCGEPGFKSRLENRDESLILCRKISDSAPDPTPPSESTQLEQRQAAEHPNLNESDHPFHLLSRESRFPIPSPAPPQSSLGDGPGQKEDEWNVLWKRTVEALMNSPEIQAFVGTNQQVFLDRGENGEIVIEILEEIPMDGSTDGRAQGDLTPDEYTHWTDVLRKAGFDVKGDAETKREEDHSGEEGDEGESRNTRDEL
ncbi:hypothetical protein HYDPIDRAFT_23859 [Hydnomerulius pinastri MD-312]|nr:hypothetical protein HYDPIDRAFT_23859 [Hydnomerulius pinastri MD-312]